MVAKPEFMAEQLDKPSRPELLAPAGNLNAALVAFDCGADAVYAGLKRFNARERTGNFTLDELARLIAYARRHERRVYVTFNTLIKEQELDPAAEMLADLADLMPHAVIVQDLGVLRMLRTFFPRLAVHASTQMGTHNSAAVNLLADLGVERVILQRQIPLPELRRIAKASRIGLEVFVHGALCCCLSGACLFSSWMGGWSGNRGKCKQPCRRRYHAESGNGFFFSTKDLYALDMLDALDDLGIAGLKIEGRLQKADYVDSTVTAYRMILDAPSGERRARLGEARAVLARSAGRQWSHGFLTRQAAADVIAADRPGSSGRLIGRVTGNATNGFHLSLNKPLRKGDRIRIQPRSADEGPALTVTRLTVNCRPVAAAAPGQACFVYCDKDVPGDGLVYRIGRATDAMTERIEKLPPARHAVAIAVRVSHTGFAVNLIEPSLDQAWTLPMQLARARTQPLDSERVADAFRTTLRDDLFAVHVTATVDGDLFVQDRTLRQVRREFWEWTGDMLARLDPGRFAGPRGLRAFRNNRMQQCDGPAFPDPDVPARSTWEQAAETVVLVRAGQVPEINGAVTARYLADADFTEDEVVLPDFCPETGIDDLRARLDKALAAGVRRVRVTSLGGLALLRQTGRKDLPVSASFPLPAANAQALQQLRELGVDRAAAWVELEKEAIERLVANGQGCVEIMAFSRLPLLTTRAHIPVAGNVSDARGNAFDIVVEANGLTRLFPAAPMALPIPAGVPILLDLTHADIDEPAASLYNYDRELA